MTHFPGASTAAIRHDRLRHAASRRNPLAAARFILLALFAAFAVSAAPAAAQGLGLPGSTGGKGAPDDPLGGLGDLPADDAGPEVAVSATLNRTTVNPGAELAVAIAFDISEGWKVWPGEGQDVLPPNVDRFAIRTAARVGTPADAAGAGTLVTQRPDWVFAAGAVQWPEPQQATNPLGGEPSMVPVLKDGAVAYLPLIIDEDIAPGVYTLPVSVLWQSCDEATCLPPTTETVELTFEVVPPGEAGSLPQRDEDRVAELFEGSDTSVFAELREGEPQLIEFDAFGFKFTLDAAGPVGLLLLALVAAVGGLLLNFTPCVLPVIPLKVMGLAKHAGDEPKRTLFLGVVMSAGVVFFWLVLGALIAFVSGFNAISALFQVPAFTLGVGVFIALMAVGMLGLFTVQLPQKLYMVNPSQETVPGSFLFGIMTAVLSTPCTAPFMGAAAAWAAAQPNKAVVLATFAAIGLGMALPYFVLSANPKWVAKLPRAGEGAEVVKKTMGLLMLAVAAFFAGTGLSGIFTTAPDPPSKLYWWFVGGFVVLAGLYLLAKTLKLAKRGVPKVAFSALALVFILLGVLGPLSFTAKGPVEWVYYTPDRFAEAQQRGDVVVLDFTAEWCLNCKALEEAVLFREAVHTRLNGPGVTPMKIDLTGKNPDGQAKLDALGRVAIPLLAIFAPGDEQPLFESDAYTVRQVLDAIDEAQPAAVADPDAETPPGAAPTPASEEPTGDTNSDPADVSTNNTTDPADTEPAPSP